MLKYICLMILLILVCLMMGFILGLKYANKEIININKFSLKHWKLYEIAISWIKNQDSIESYIIRNGYKKVGIYGMSYLGDCLVDVLKKKEIEIVCGIDRNADKLYNPYIPIYNMEKELPVMDLVIVTTILCFEQVKSELEERLGKGIKIISLEEILYI